MARGLAAGGQAAGGPRVGARQLLQLQLELLNRRGSAQALGRRRVDSDAKQG